MALIAQPDFDAVNGYTLGIATAADSLGVKQ